eukprot:gene17665-32988_t
MFVFGIVSALATAASDGWSRGVDGKLSVLADGTSYTFAYGSHTFTSTPKSLATAAGAPSTINGSDIVGSLAVRYYSSMDSFVFERTPTALGLPTTWPSFQINDQPANTSRCLGWSDHYFYPGGNSWQLSDCNSQGPLYFHGTHRNRASAVTELSAWNDNQAAYSWWTVGTNQK